MPSRVTSRRRVDRGPRLPILVRVAIVVAIVVLGGFIALKGVGVAGGVVKAIGSSFSDLIASVASSPSPSPIQQIAPNAPMLVAPAESYTNQAKIDVSGAIPAAAVGKADVSVRLYRSVEKAAPVQVADTPAGATPSFTFPQVTLAKGRNDFTATVVGPGGESPVSSTVTYILDTTKPKITITKPTKNAVINGATVTIQGKTKPRCALVARNEANNASITGVAGGDGSFTLVLAIAAGPNGIRITATDPAQNQSEVIINVLRGSGNLTGTISLSRYQFPQSALPANITITVVVRDPNGRPVAGATVTFMLTPPGVPVISQVLTTDGTGTASWPTTIPKGATVNQGNAAALIDAGVLGTKTVQTVIKVTK